MKTWLRSVAVGGACLASSAGFAQGIPAAYQSVAEQYAIPADIFFAIALAESGREKPGSINNTPWPWTLNVHGEGQYFQSRRSAWRAMLSAIARQQTSIDVGPMQISWRYHRKRLVNAWLALDPYRNLIIAAEILTDCQARLNDWWASVGCYHAPQNPIRAERYRQRVIRLWRALRP